MSLNLLVLILFFIFLSIDDLANTT